MTVEEANARLAGTFSGTLGVEITGLHEGAVTARLPVRPDLLAANGYLHGAAVVAIADTACAFGAFTHLPGDATGFTTIELKSNFLATAREGTLACEATLAHGGRTTQVWDARVTSEESGRTLALFRCTQLLLRR